MGQPPIQNRKLWLSLFSKTITIKDNIIAFEGQARPLLRSKESYGATIKNNALSSVSDTDRYENTKTDARSGLEEPLKFLCDEFNVDGWKAGPVEK